MNAGAHQPFLWTRSHGRGLDKEWGRSAFTLIEIMVAIGIMAVVLAMGMPAIYKSLRQEGIRKACADLLEGCVQARAQAILQGVAADFVIRAEDGTLSIQMVPDSRPRSMNELTVNLRDNTEARGPAAPSFSARLPENVAVELLDINFVDHMDAGEARVRFHPNGTSDEFTIVLRSEDGEVRKISLEVVTGIATMDVMQ